VTQPLTDKTREYWIGILRGWAEDRLSEPQYAECSAVLDEYITPSEIREWAITWKETAEKRAAYIEQLEAQRDKLSKVVKEIHRMEEEEERGGYISSGEWLQLCRQARTTLAELEVAQP
jgi:hypothetical protein